MASNREEGEFSESSSSSGEEESDEEQSSNQSGPSALKFKNDGSFLEMFKKMQDSQQPQQPPQPVSQERTLKQENKTDSQGGSSNTAKAAVKKEEEPSSAVPQKKPGLMSIVGKRRGGKALPVGVVKKQKRPEDEQEETGKTDAWSQYMSEVKKYKERLGDEEDKNRPLVK